MTAPWLAGLRAGGSGSGLVSRAALTHFGARFLSLRLARDPPPLPTGTGFTETHLLSSGPCLSLTLNLTGWANICPRKGELAQLEVECVPGGERGHGPRSGSTDAPGSLGRGLGDALTIIKAQSALISVFLK
uniref:Uncharacterized protein n=1 Tax=Rangifer tarandus platyrhynchus TaxID=3082113 RepID=A0ACB0EIP3_RANTA|nr:unnamed protein product [Rangifer tarandus platyrhynchus]